MPIYCIALIYSSIANRNNKIKQREYNYTYRMMTSGRVNTFIMLAVIKSDVFWRKMG